MTEEISPEEKPEMLPESELCVRCLVFGVENKATYRKNGNCLCDDCGSDYELMFCTGWE